VSSPEAPNSSTPGACAAGTAFSAASATSPRLTARANSDDAPATRSTSASVNSGWPACRTRISAPQHAPSATKALRSSGPKPAGVNSSRKRGLLCGRPAVAWLIVAARRAPLASCSNLLTSATAYSLSARTSKRSGRSWSRCCVIRSEPGSRVCQQAPSKGIARFSRAAAWSKNSALLDARKANRSTSDSNSRGAQVSPLVVVVSLPSSLASNPTPANLGWAIDTALETMSVHHERRTDEQAIHDARAASG
jgi:hypothetical protein